MLTRLEIEPRLHDKPRDGQQVEPALMKPDNV